MIGPNGQIVELYTGDVRRSVLQMEFERPLEKEQFYHLAASGLFREIKIVRPMPSGGFDTRYLCGDELARLVEEVNLERAAKVAVTVELKTAPKVTRAKAVKAVVDKSRTCLCGIDFPSEADIRLHMGQKHRNWAPEQVEQVAAGKAPR